MVRVHTIEPRKSACVRHQEMEKNMNNTRLKWSVLAMGALGFASSMLVGGDAHGANRMGGLASRPADPSKYGCLGSSGQGIVNNCATNVHVQAVATVTNTAGVNFSPGIFVYADGDTSCRAVGLSADQTGFFTSGWHNANEDSGGNKMWSSIPAIGATWVPGDGSLVFECFLVGGGSGSKISHFNW